MHNLTNKPYYRALRGFALLTTVLALAGCTALTSTTRQAGKASKAIVKGTAHASRATTNASVTDPDSPRYAEATAFVRSQRQQLARQAAVGSGDDIDALGNLLDKPDNQALGRWMQSHYHTLFSNQSVSASTIVSRIDAQAG